jgi:Lrp/AsnC family transcriptional regulator, leucine-responsive regulatory protein
MSAKLDDRDIAILALLQENSKLTAKQIAKKVNSPITTVFAKIKRMEDLGIIKEYRAILDPEKIGSTTAAFILASVSYRTKGDNSPVSQRVVAEEISRFQKFRKSTLSLVTGICL